MIGLAGLRFGEAAALRVADVDVTASLTISAGAGANVKMVQRLLGHKTAVLTLDRYGHLFPDLNAVADAFDSAAGDRQSDGGRGRDGL